MMSASSSNTWHLSQIFQYFTVSQIVSHGLKVFSIPFDKLCLATLLERPAVMKCCRRGCLSLQVLSAPARSLELCQSDFLVLGLLPD